MFDHVRTPPTDLQRRAAPAIITLFRATADVLLLTVLAVYVGRRGTPFEVGLVTVAYYLSLTVFAPVWGALSDVSGRRYAVLLSTCAMSTLAVLPFLGIGGVWPLIVAFGFYTTFAAGYSPLVLAIVSERSTPDDRGGSVGVINSTRAAGGTFGRVGAGVLVGLFAPIFVFIAIAAVSAVGVVGSLFVAHERPNLSQTTDPGAVVREVKSRLLPDVSGDVLRGSGLRWLYVSVSVQGMAVTGVLALMPVYLTQAVGTTEETMGLLLGISPALQSILLYPMGVLSDWIGRKRMIVIGTFGRGVLFPVLASMVTSVAGLKSRIAIVVVAFVVLAGTFSAMFSGTVAFIGDATPDDRSGEFMGLLWTALGVGGVLGPLLLGSVATVTGYEFAFLVAAGVALVATLVASRGIDADSAATSQPD